ncbi:MAG: hypothetical protein KBA26_06435 [Candidatus Delongbacteria bacterium]|nr:hypothetical protein [Candidatus Delongbacteria bacterium]
MAKSGSLRYGIDDKPPVSVSLLLGLQYVLLNIGGMIIMPIIITHACGLETGQTEYLIFGTLLVSAFSSFIQIRRIGRIGSGYLMILGPSGAFIACSISAVQLGGLALLGMMTLLSAPLELIMASMMRYTRKVFTPALSGTVIMLVALMIIPLTIGMWTGQPDDPRYCSPAYFISGLVPLAIILGSYLSDREWFRLWSPIIGTATGIGVAILFGIADFSAIQQYSWLDLPGSGWPGLEWNIGRHHFPLLMAFIMATLASSIETIGNTVALQNISEGKISKIKYDRIQGGLNVDAVGSMVAGMVGVPANTTYSNIMPIIQLTKVSSRVVGYYAASILAIIAFMPKIAYLFLSIPNPVMGGLTIGLMAILLGEGLKVAASSELSPENGIVIGTGMSFGLLACIGQFFPALFPEQFRFLASDVITIGGMTALLLSIIFACKIRKSESLTLPADPKRLADLHQKIDSFQDRFRMSSKQTFALQLACEEVFSYYNRQNDLQAGLRFQWKYHPEYIITEIISRKGNLNDVDVCPDPARLISLDDESLRDLGLFLLSKVAVNIEHSTIDGYHFIQFRVKEPE